MFKWLGIGGRKNKTLSCSLYDKMVESNNWGWFSGLGLSKEDLEGWTVVPVPGDIVNGKQGWEVLCPDGKPLPLRGPIFPPKLALYIKEV